MSAKARTARPRRSPVGVVVGLLLKVLLTAVAVAVPLVGVWVASSLAVYLDGPLWLAITAGALLAFALPLGWELWSGARRRRRKVRDERILTTFDRLVLRTLALNLAFLAVVLFAYPRQGFAALATRGDWMLGDAHGETAESVRGALFEVASGLEWLYSAATPNRYAQYADAEADGDVRPAPTPTPDGTAAPTGEAGVPLGGTDHRWPFAATVHPAVAALPASAQGSIEAVARYLAGQISDPFERVKALHDFATVWLAYDAEGLARGVLPSQQAEDVFAARKAVCAGYAKLLVALGAVTGDKIVYLVGHARSEGDDLDGVGHAWNGVELDGAWYLIDATWDAGSVSGDQFIAKYRTDYLFTPPAIFGIDHFPDEARWQLLATPLTRGDFLRQPALQPGFFAEGLTLVSPTRSQVDVADAVALQLDNPRGAWVMAVAVDKDSGAKVRCGEATADARATLSCALPAAGRYQIELFGNREQYGTFAGLGYVEVNAGG